MKGLLILLRIEDDGTLYSPQGCGSFVSRKELAALQEAITNTLSVYDRENITDEIIADNAQERIQKRIEEIELNSVPNKVLKKDDHLYLIRNTENNRLKLGRSINPEARLKQLNIASSERLVLIGVKSGLGELEQQLHYEFQAFRTNTEWYEYSEKILNRFYSLIEYK